MIFYKNPVISGILLNSFTMFLSIYAIKYNITPLILMIVFVGILNRKIIDNGMNMNSKKKTLIIVSFIVMISTFLYIMNIFIIILIKYLIL